MWRARERAVLCAAGSVLEHVLRTGVPVGRPTVGAADGDVLGDCDP
jgi:hypothetical protein